MTSEFPGRDWNLSKLIQTWEIYADKTTFQQILT